MGRWTAALLLVMSSLVLSCGHTVPEEKHALQFWHTFNQEESAALQGWLAKTRKHSVVTTILPFALANIRFRSALQEGGCPDLLRIDATRIPGLVESKIIAQVPDSVWQQRKWLRQAEDLILFEDARYGLPQSLDGLALIRQRNRQGPWPFQTLEELEEFARAGASSESQKNSKLGVLIDGYWFLAFLRAASAELPQADGLPSIHNPAAALALERFTSWFRNDWAIDLLDERTPSRAMAKAFRTGSIEVAFTGPWDLRALAGDSLDSLQVSAFPGGSAPRGGQVLVVPNCSTNASKAWALAMDLSAPELQARWARELGSIPVTAEGLRQGGRVAKEFYQALAGTRQLPRHPRAPELFDDLTPAVMAVVGGDATADEALAGVDRAWRRLYGLPPERTE